MQTSIIRSSELNLQTFHTHLVGQEERFPQHLDGPIGLSLQRMVVLSPMQQRNVTMKYVNDRDK